MALGRTIVVAQSCDWQQRAQHHASAQVGVGTGIWRSTARGNPAILDHHPYIPVVATRQTSESNQTNVSVQDGNTGQVLIGQWSDGTRACINRNQDSRQT